ncbi:unnamed protein product [Candidula unifasciata]|uniref:Centromere protein W n=1 Tax=Candidula unifasciata TaxID=100452 RepID=A0A8S3ZL73_9EUPU|nr:unnamed protein product [Candidula unifasciata]
MTVVFSHYNRSKVKKRSFDTMQHVKITKGAVMSLLLVHYNFFLRSLLKEANIEARNCRSKLTKGEHIRAVAKKVLQKYRR